MWLWLCVLLIGFRFMSPSWCNTFKCFILRYCRRLFIFKLSFLTNSTTRCELHQSHRVRMILVRAFLYNEVKNIITLYVSKSSALRMFFPSFFSFISFHPSLNSSKSLHFVPHAFCLLRSVHTAITKNSLRLW